MVELVYIISMAVAFTSNYSGATINYYTKIYIGLAWIVVWLAAIATGRKKLRPDKMLMEYIKPWLLIMVWSGIVWVLNKPNPFDSSYVTRMISNTSMIMISCINAYAASVFFGKRVIKLTFMALILSIVANAIKVIPMFGMADFIKYLKNVAMGEFEYGSRLWLMSNELEVQGPTMTLGIFVIYFLWFDTESRWRTRILFSVIAIAFSYIGFKRTEMFGILSVFLLLGILRNKHVNLKYVIRISGIVIMVLFFSYIILVKTDLIVQISEKYSIDTMGRISIYRFAAKMFELSPFYCGKGFCYVAKYMYDQIGFVTHSEAVRMYSEIGAIPCFIWLYHYVLNIPMKITNQYGYKAGRTAMAVTIYVFVTYLVENTLVLYPMQFCLTLFAFVEMHGDGGGMVHENGNIIYAALSDFVGIYRRAVK